MFGHTFYFSTIRKYVTLFGTLFNDIHITRTDANNNTVALIKVPLAYAPKEKVLARVDADPNIDRQTAIILPRMSFEMLDMRYDTSRKLNTIGRTVKKDPDSTSKLKYQYNPVPYNISFRLYVYVKNAEDGTKIIEQILPFFTPDWTTTVQLIPEMGINMDIPVVLDNINIEDSYEGNFEKRRALIWTLDFTLKGYIYGPVKKSGVIKFANTNFYIPPNVEDGYLQDAVGVTNVSERITIRPGLTANGAPTSNVSQSVSLSEIEVDDDFGYCVSIDTIITE
jgi:hypothetical protein